MDHNGAPAAPDSRPRLGEVARLFGQLGLTAFGGPAAHVALMRQEIVVRRRWVSEQQFLDLLGASNLIPGPTSTELAIYLGYVLAGRRGLVLAGCLFILPAMLLVLAFAWAYVRFGTTPVAGGLLYGVKPVIIAVVAQALWALGRTALKTWLLAAVALVALAVYGLGTSPLLALGLGIALAVVAAGARRWAVGRRAAAVGVPLLGLGQAAPGAATFGYATLFLTFLKIGSVLYGSGYVLLAFLRDDFVDRLGWLTDQQLIDAVAIGQFTPGPVFTTATFIGYLTGGVAGALVATVAIFLPSFVFVALVYPLLPRLQAWPWTRVALDGVNAAALGLMAAVTLQLARSAIVDVPTALLALAALGVLLLRPINSAWLVVGGAAVGLLLQRLPTG
jgi:chromate transporter